MKRPPASIHIFPLALIVLGFIASVASALLTGAGGGFVGLLLLIAITALLAGGLLGFLFGIPKVNRQYAPGDDYAKSRKYFPNTNLEEVSDWLTKIIIGVGLTQLIRIPEYLRNLATGILKHVEYHQVSGNAAPPYPGSGHPLFLHRGLYRWLLLHAPLPGQPVGTHGGKPGEGCRDRHLEGRGEKSTPLGQKRGLC